MRGGPDLRLVNVSKSGLAERFGVGDGRRKSLESLEILKKVKTYYDPSKESSTSPSSETAIVAVPEPTPPPQPKSPHWFRALRGNDAEPDQSTQSPAATPTASPDIFVQHPHVHSKSENLLRKPDASTDDSRSEYIESPGHSNRSIEGKRSMQLSQKPVRPRFPRWRSHSSSLLKRGKALSPPDSVAKTPLPLSDDSHKQLSPGSARKHPKRSIKPWRWHDPLTSSDAQSIADVINTPEMTARDAQLENKEGGRACSVTEWTVADSNAAPLHAQTPPPASHKSDRRTRFGSTQQSTDLGKLELPLLRNSPLRPSQAELFTPNPVNGRREGQSYFAVDETSPPSPSRKLYSADFIGTALGGISPDSSPPKSTPASAGMAPSSPDRDEYFEAKMLSHRHATARSSTMPLEFVPPGSARVSTPPEFSSRRGSRGRTAGFFFAGPSPGESPGIEGGPRRLREPRSPSSSGYWDSDAVLMSQLPFLDENDDHIDDDDDDDNHDEWDKVPQQQQRLAPQTTPDPELEWFRVRMDPGLANEAQSNKEADVSSNAAFEWDVPEHLPGSPLCPLSPKHKGGGKGICVYHGRKKLTRRAAF